MGACLRAVSVFAGRKREMLFDVIFVLLFVILKNPECRIYHGSCFVLRLHYLFLRSRLECVHAKKHCGRVGWSEKLNHAVGISVGRFG